MQQALQVFEQVMNDSLFQHKLSRKKFHYDRKDNDHRGYTTAQVMAEVWAGKEWFTGAQDGTANIFWYVREQKKPERSKYATISGGNPTSNSFYTNSWYVDKNDNLHELAGHLAHEWGHKLRFLHKYNPHKRREKTFPYVFGNLVRKHAARYVSLR